MRKSGQTQKMIESLKEVLTVEKSCMMPTNIEKPLLVERLRREGFNVQKHYANNPSGFIKHKTFLGYIVKRKK